MGNAEVHNLAPTKEDQSRALDLSSKVDHDSFTKHLSGEYSPTCLYDLPWELNDTICLFENVNLSFNCLTSVPALLPFRLPHLCFLDISFNQVENLPPTFGLLFHLRVLFLSHNKLRDLPESFTQLENLVKLDLSNNQLVELPAHLGKMKSLRKLNVGYNALTGLPKSLGASSTLELVIACGNKCETCPPQSVCEKGSESILAFMRELHKDTMRSPRNQLLNCFSRVRSNQVATSVPNPHSARAQYLQLQTETMNTASRVKTPLLPPFGATVLQPDELRDKVIGLIYGAVIGDALGLCTEFLSRDACYFQYEESDLHYNQVLRDDHRLRWNVGDWTDNSDQMFLVLNSLLQWGGVVDELDFARRLLFWKKKGFPELGDSQGHLTSHTISLVLQDESYQNYPHTIVQKIVGQPLCSNGTSKNHTVNVGFNDNGALPRAPILGIPHFHDLCEVSNNSLRICLSTHSSPKCRASCQALSLMVALTLQGKINLTDKSLLEESLHLVQTMAGKHLTDSEESEEFNECFRCQDFTSAELRQPGLMSHTFKPLTAAVAAFRTAHDFKSCLSALVMCGGHASMNGCIVGALLGCYYGFQHLPKNWVEDLLPRQSQWANQKINTLLDIMGLP